MDNSLDAEVAERIMGWHRVEGHPVWFDGDKFAWADDDTPAAAEWYRSNRDTIVPQWSPTTDMRAAWLVVERMDRFYTHDNITLCDRWVKMRAIRECVNFVTTREGWEVKFHTTKWHFAPTLPEAICRAALAAVEA